MHPQNYKKMTETLLLSMLIIAICMLLLLVKVLIKRNGTFTSQHIHDSKAMKRKKIYCVLDQDIEMRKHSVELHQKLHSNRNEK